MLWDIALIFGMLVYNDELQIKLTFRSGSTIFGWVMGPLDFWYWAKYLVVTTLFLCASYQISVHLATRFQRRSFFSNPPTRNNCLWWPCLLTNRDEMSVLHRGPSIDASYQVSVHMAKQFQRRRFFKNQPIRNKNCMWWPCLWTGWVEMSNLYRDNCILNTDIYIQTRVIFL